MLSRWFCRDAAGRNGPRRPIALCSDAAGDTAGRVRLRRMSGTRITAGCLAVGLALVVGLGSLWLPAAVGAKTTQELQQDLGVTRDRLREVREGKQEALQRLAAAERDIQALDQQIDGLEGQLEQVMERADAAQARLDATQAELNQVAAELEATRRRLQKAEEDLHTQQTVLNQRLVSAYKSGTLGFVELLLESVRFSDLLNRLDLVGIILRQDQDVLQQIAALKGDMEEQRSALETRREAVSALAVRQRAEADELAAAVAEKQSAMEALAVAREGKQVAAARAESDKVAFEQQEEELAARSEEIRRVLQSAGISTIPTQGTGALSMPLHGELSSRFGMRTLFGVTRMHNGIDISAPLGTPIKAADGGKVILADWNGGYGKCVIINHGGGVATLYGHLSEIRVSVGKGVSQGEVIGLCGSTGFSTGPHLHFEVRINGSPVDPLGYL